MATNKTPYEAYKLKDNITREQLVEAGFMPMTADGKDYFACFVPQPLDGELVQGTLNGVYNDPAWKDRFYTNHKKLFKEKIGLTYSSAGKAILTKKFKKILTQWRVQIEFDFKYLEMMSLDPFDGAAYNNAVVLDKYCGKLIDELKELDFIERVEYKQ